MVAYGPRKKVLILVLLSVLLFSTCNLFEPYSGPYYITETGSKYPREDCRYLWNSKIEISLEEAKARGYMACSVCDP
jgi:hypothetical protein